MRVIEFRRTTDNKVIFFLNWYITYIVIVIV